jgi:uncharacterized membrane protein YfcA
MDHTFIIPAVINWNLDLPILVVVISLVYSATRHENWRFIIQHALLWMLYITTFLGVTCGILYLVAIDIPAYWFVPILLVIGYMFFATGRPKKKRSHEGAATRSSATGN